MPARELELAGAISAGGWLRWRKKHADAPLGSPCATCETPLQGPYCHMCGQLAENFHKNAWHLVTEVFESFFHWDGRLFRTVPRLLFAPHKLTREYLDGRRALQIPPLRLYLVVLLILFFVGSIPGARGRDLIEINSDGLPGSAASAKADKLPNITFSNSYADDVVAERTGKATAAKLKQVEEQAGKLEAKHSTSRDFGYWFGQRLKRAAEHPKEFKAVISEWAHRLAMLMLPIAAVLLSLLFVFQRRWFLYDHLIFAMHSLSFSGLLLSLAMGVQALIGPPAMLLLLIAPVHLFVHMRGTYGISVIGTLLRMFVLFVGSFVGFALIMTSLFLIGLNAMVG